MKPHIFAGEDGSVFIEWIGKDERYYIALEAKIEESSWGHVWKTPGGEPLGMEGEVLGEEWIKMLRNWAYLQ